jgi:hypothetical protein
MFKLQSNFPIPPVRRSATPVRRKYPFETMEVGEMFFVEGKKKNTLGTHVSTVSKQLGRKFSTRLTFARQGAKGWEPCDPDADGAVQGVGVWRMK